MPEMRFYITWPDGEKESCYSPSLVIGDFLKPGHTYALADFVDRCDQALTEASNRVQQKFGYFCSSAMDQLGRIKEKANQFTTVENASVTVDTFSGYPA